MHQHPGAFGAVAQMHLDADKLCVCTSKKSYKPLKSKYNLGLDFSSSYGQNELLLCRFSETT